MILFGFLSQDGSFRFLEYTGVFDIVNIITVTNERYAAITATNGFMPTKVSRLQPRACIPRTDFAVLKQI